MQQALTFTNKIDFFLVTFYKLKYTFSNFIHFTICFIYLERRKEEVERHFLVPLQMFCDSWCWVKLKQRTENFILASYGEGTGLAT